MPLLAHRLVLGAVELVDLLLESTAIELHRDEVFPILPSPGLPTVSPEHVERQELLAEHNPAVEDRSDVSDALLANSG